MLLNTELAVLRQVAAQALPDRCIVQRRTLAADGRLGQATTWAVNSVTLPCRVEELGQGRGQREAELAGRLASQGDYIVRLPYDVEISEKDRLVVELEHDTRTLEVSRVIVTSYATLTSALCTEVR